MALKQRERTSLRNLSSDERARQTGSHIHRNFARTLSDQMRQHNDTCDRLCRAILRREERFNVRTIRAWLNGENIPRTALSFEVLGRIERRYGLPHGHFVGKLPSARGPAGLLLADISSSERSRISWHLPHDFQKRKQSEQLVIIEWIRSHIIRGGTAFRRHLIEKMRAPYAFKFNHSPNALRSAPSCPKDLSAEVSALVQFKSATLSPPGTQRNGRWSPATCSLIVEHLGLLFGALSSPARPPIEGANVPANRLSMAMLVLPNVWDWYLSWRERRRGFFTSWESNMMSFAAALTRRRTGWLRQNRELATRIAPVAGLISSSDVAIALNDWDRACDEMHDHALARAREIKRLSRKHRDPFEPILPVLEAANPVRTYGLIADEIIRRMPNSRRSPIAAAEAVRGFLMLRLGLHLGVRQKNLRELLICQSGCPAQEADLVGLRRGELRWLDNEGAWEVLIPCTAFKNAGSTFFAGRSLRVRLPDIVGLYEQIDVYLRLHRPKLLKGFVDPGTFFVKTVKRSSKSAEYSDCSFYLAWRLVIERYGVFNPFTKKGAIDGLLPHGPHCVRDVLATHILKQTGSYEQASYAIQDTPATVAKHYGRFFPDHKAAIAAEILSRAWE